LGTIRSVSTRGRSFDGVDSSGDKTTITTIPAVGVYSSSDKTTIATFPAFQDDLQSASPLDICVHELESMLLERIYATMLLYISVSLRTRQDTISYSLYNFIVYLQCAELGENWRKDLEESWGEDVGKIGERWGKTWRRLERRWRRRGEDWRERWGILEKGL